MLDRDQRATLTEFIYVQLPANPNIGAIAVFVGQEIAQELPSFPRIRDISVWMIDQALQQQTPDLLIKLIQTVDDGQGTLGSIISLADALAANAGPWTDWLRTSGHDTSTGGDPLHVKDGRPFLDRGKFRNFVPRPNALDTPPCILIEGDTGSGKTYLHEYLKQLSTNWNNFFVGFTAVGSSNARSMTPETASIDLARGLRTDFRRRPRAHEDPHRYARNLVSWITEYTPKRDVPAMAVFDGFDAPGVTEPMQTFIEGLVRTVQEDAETKKRLRIALLGYEASRLEQQELEFERCPLEYLGASHVEKWLKRRYPGQPDYAYEDTAALIAQELPASGELRLHQLCNLVVVAMNEFGDGQ